MTLNRRVSVPAALPDSRAVVHTAKLGLDGCKTRTRCLSGSDGAVILYGQLWCILTGFNECMLTGWNGNQVVGGILLQTLRNTVSHACKRRFDKFSTLCTEQLVVYNEDTGEAVAVATTSGGLRPYGVDAVFLADSSAYDDTLVLGKHVRCNRCKEEAKL